RGEVTIPLSDPEDRPGSVSRCAAPLGAARPYMGSRRNRPFALARILGGGRVASTHKAHRDAPRARTCVQVAARMRNLPANRRARTRFHAELEGALSTSQAACVAD